MVTLTLPIYLNTIPFKKKAASLQNNILQEIDTYLCIQLKFDKIPRDNESNYIFHKRIASL
jgi:hypothetical protein